MSDTPLTSRPIAELSEAELMLIKKSDKLKKYKLPKAWTIAELQETEFPDPVWIVPGLIPEGLTILAGAQKIGKSWLCLQLASALSVGGTVFGSIRVPKTETLYLALEDGPRRMKNRLEKIEALPDSNTVHIVHEWHHGDDGLGMLEAWMLNYPDTRCIIIDTLGKIWPHGLDQNDYADTTSFASRLKAFADAFHIAIVCVTHTRKAEIDDYVSGIIGSTGITAVADTILSITRSRGNADAVLKATGRDTAEKELALRFSPECATWTILGDAADVQKTRERQVIVDYLRENETAKTSQIAKDLGKQDSAISNLLRKLKAEGLIYSPKYGVWAIRNTGVSDVSSESTRNDESELTSHSSLSAPFSECKIDNFLGEYPPNEEETLELF
jgi:DNA-binding transcriptional ArsR family regulator